MATKVRRLLRLSSPPPTLARCRFGERWLGRPRPLGFCLRFETSRALHGLVEMGVRASLALGERRFGWVASPALGVGGRRLGRRHEGYLSEGRV